MTNIRYGGGAVVADHQDGGHLLSLDKFGSFEFLVEELTPRLRSHVGVVLTAVESIIGKVRSIGWQARHPPQCVTLCDISWLKYALDAV